MRLTCSQAAKLVRLDAGESLPRSQLPKALLDPLQQAGVVCLEKSGPSYVVRGLPGKLASFVAHHWGIRDLARYAQATPDNRNREVLADIAGDSKALPNQPFDGIFIRSFGNCFLSDEPLNLSPFGTAVLVTIGELPRLRIHADHLIGIENPMCLWYFENVLKHFPDLKDLGYVLVLRWHWSSTWRRWLDGWNGQMHYFPDYDPAGLRIFVTEVLPHQPNARLLIPQDFEAILDEHGSRDLYLKQEKYLPLQEEQADVAFVCRCLRKGRKAFEQEVLLSRNKLRSLPNSHG